jgi:predicted ATP-grasp superfamily ATP-dependent carboligase
VLALGSGITLLGVLRALSETEFDVFVLPDTEGPARRSRWFRPGPPSLAGLKPSMLARALESLPSPTVLIPCSDLWVRTVAGLPSEFQARYPFSVAPLEAIEVLVDKNRFRETLARLGLPHPTTHMLRSGGDLDGVPDSVLRSSFLKPVSSQEFFARFGVKGFRIAGRGEAVSALSRCTDAGLKMMLQEYIPGPPTNHYFIDGFVDRAGTVCARFARRRLRMSPPDFGNSTIMESVPVADVGTGAATLDALFAFLHYRGIFSAEFKRDERDGVFNLIEVNARPWWYVEFAARCGVNVCKLAVRDALGQPVETIGHYALGRRCVFPYYDVDALRAEARAGRLSLPAGVRSWLGAYQPVFRWSDPLPALSDVAGLIRRRLK